MSKVNYAKIRNSQKRSETNPDSAPPLEVHISAGGSLAVGDRTPYPVAPGKIDSAGLTNLFGENVVMDNLDYINSLLGPQLPGSAGVPQKRKRSKHKLDDSSNQPRSSDKVIAPSSPVKASGPLNAPLNSPGNDPSSSLLNPYEIETSQVTENKDEELIEEYEDKMKWRANRNMSNMISRKEVEIYEEYLQKEAPNDVGKRSMSVEDVRIPKRDFSKATVPTKNNGSVTTEVEIFGDESVHMTTDPTQGSIMQDITANKPPRSDFSSKIGQYIDYFHKSESSQYRTRKASQYMGGSINHVGSRTESQRSGQSKNNDFEKMASQIRKLKAKVNDLQLTNELLSNERKTWKKIENELLDRAENAENELVKMQNKAKKYKEKLKYTQELLQREKLDNENNLLALRRVLANNISTVLEHKIHHYMNGEQPKGSASDKGSIHKKSSKDGEYRKTNNPSMSTLLTNSGNQPKGGRYEENVNMKKWKKAGLKDKMSPLLSQKDQSFSDDEGPPERLTTLSKSDELDAEELLEKNRRFHRYSPRQSDFETSSELGEEFQYYFYGNQQDTSKKYQQIQYLQNQLSKLMEKEENSSHTNSNYSKSSHRNKDQYSGNKQRSHPHSSHTLKGRESNYSKATSFSKQHEQQARMYRKDLDDTLSPNEALNNPSFSNSESGWTTSLGK